MTATLRIALFAPVKSEREGILRLFNRPEYEVHQVLIPADIITVMSERRVSFDTAIIPQLIDGDTGGVSTALQMKSVGKLASIPLIALSSTGDMAVLEAMYGAGADVVMPAPYEPNRLYFQITALARLKRAYDEQIRQNYETSGLRLSTINGFNTVREGIVITDTMLEPVFINDAARLMLDLEDDDLTSDKAVITTNQFIPHIQKLIESSRTHGDSPQGEGSLYKECTIKRSHGQSFRVGLNITGLYGQDSVLAGYAVSISDLTEIYQLTNLLVQSERTRTLSLMSTACCRSLLPNGMLGTPTAPLGNIKSVLEKEQTFSNLGSVVTSLLECLDSVVSEDVSFRVEIDEVTDLRIKGSHIFQILGHMILRSADFAGPGGEVFVESTKDEQNPKGVYIITTAISKRVTPLIRNDYLSDLLHGNYAKLEGGAENPDKLTLGLDAAQSIADIYKTDIELRHTSDNRLKLRVFLPLA